MPLDLTAHFTVAAFPFGTLAPIGFQRRRRFHGSTPFVIGPTTRQSFALHAATAAARRLTPRCGSRGAPSLQAGRPGLCRGPRVQRRQDGYQGKFRLQPRSSDAGSSARPPIWRDPNRAADAGRARSPSRRQRHLQEEVAGFLVHRFTRIERAILRVSRPPPATANDAS